MAQTIQCAFGVDDGYCPHMATAIASLALTNRHNRLHVTVLHAGLHADNLARLDRLFARFPNLTGEARLVGIEDIADFPILSFSLATYFRLLLPDILPGIDRIIYLDSDLIVRADIRPLWDLELDGALIAAAADATTHIEARLGLAPPAFAFNAGVMLIDLAAWRREEVAARSIRFVKDNHDAIQLVDQDALNVVLAGRVRELDFGWNFQPWVIANKPKLPLKPALARRNPNIVHFAHNWKPWRYKDDSMFERDYLFYRRATPWAPFVQPDRTLKLRGRRLRRRLAGIFKRT